MNSKLILIVVSLSLVTLFSEPIIFDNIGTLAFNYQFKDLKSKKQDIKVYNFPDQDLDLSYEQLVYINAVCNENNVQPLEVYFLLLTDINNDLYYMDAGADIWKQQVTLRVSWLYRLKAYGYNMNNISGFYGKKSFNILELK